MATVLIAYLSYYFVISAIATNFYNMYFYCLGLLEIQSINFIHRLFLVDIVYSNTMANWYG